MVRVLAIPTKGKVQYTNSSPRLDYKWRYARMLKRGKIRACPNTISADAIKIHPIEKFSTYDTEVFVEVDISETGQNIFKNWEQYGPLLEEVVSHRSRICTVATQWTERNEIVNVLPERMKLDRDKKETMGVKYRPLIKEALLLLLYAKLDNLVPKLNVAYLERKASVFPGLQWYQLTATDVYNLYLLTKEYLEHCIYAIEHDKFMILPPYNLGIRARPQVVVDIRNWSPGKYYGKEFFDRTRAVFFTGGPSSVNALQKAGSREEMKVAAQDYFIKMMKILGIPVKLGRSIYTDRGWLYDNVYRKLKDGKWLINYDGKAWEATTAMICGMYGSPFATWISGMMLFTSGNFITSALNTLMTLLMDIEYGIFDLGYEVVATGDDNVIIVDDVAQAMKVIKFPKFEEFQPMDTKWQFILGISFLDLDHPHSMGMKFASDSAGKYRPINNREDTIIKKGYSIQEQKAYELVYTDWNIVLPKLPEVFPEMEFFAPRFLQAEIVKSGLGDNLKDYTGPDRNLQDIMARYQYVEAAISA